MRTGFLMALTNVAIASLSVRNSAMTETFKATMDAILPA
jgi:hypothetical protein